MSVPVQMIRSDVGYDGDVCLEVVYVVQLEAAQLQYIYVEVLGRDLVRVAFADVSSNAPIPQ